MTAAVQDLDWEEQASAAGYTVEFRVDQGGRHWPSTDFLPEALDWFFSEPWAARS